MEITIVADGTTVTLPPDTLWIDRHSWTPVEQMVNTSITGAAIIDVGTRVNGRPITLQSDPEHAWMVYGTVNQLKAWGATPGKQMALTIGTDTFQVIFRHQDKPAIDVTAVVDYSNIDALDWFFGTLKFTEI